MHLSCQSEPETVRVRCRRLARPPGSGLPHGAVKLLALLTISGRIDVSPSSPSPPVPWDFVLVGPPPQMVTIRASDRLDRSPEIDVAQHPSRSRSAPRSVASQRTTCRSDVSSLRRGPRVLTGRPTTIKERREVQPANAHGGATTGTQRE